MFVKLSDSNAKKQKIPVDNLFILDYMPFAPDLCVKVYLYGLSLALSGMDNSIDMIANRLSVSPDEVFSAYKYWENQGLVAIITVEPPLVEYKEVRPASEQIRYFNKTKFKAFNDQLHAMLKGRNITQNEYAEYYSAIETLHIEKEAMLAIIAYCVRLKGETIGYPYILTVARNLAAEGITSFDRVAERLSELDLYDAEVRTVLKALGSKRGPDAADKRLWLKWTKDLGFSSSVIIKVAKEQKKAGGIDTLDRTLMRYYNNRVLSYEEIQNYNDTREKLYSLTAAILKILSLYYERLDYIIESYTQKWLSLGFGDEALILIAKACFKKNQRKLEDMDESVDAFYKKGLLSVTAITGHLEAVGRTEDAENETVKRILAAAGLVQDKVLDKDRTAYRTWSYMWGMPQNVIEYAAALSQGKGLGYISAILSSWHSKNIRTLDAAKKEPKTSSVSSLSGTAAGSMGKVTSKSIEELNAYSDEITLDEI